MRRKSYTKIATFLLFMFIISVNKIIFYSCFEFNLKKIPPCVECAIGQKCRIPLFQIYFRIFFFFQIFFKIWNLPSQSPTNHPTILLDILGSVDLKQTFSYVDKLYFVFKYFNKKSSLFVGQKQKILYFRESQN